MNTIVEPAVASMQIVSYAKSYEAQVRVLAQAMHDESVFHRHIPLDVDKLIQQVEAAAVSTAHYFRLCVRGDEVIGGFLGHISSVYFSQDKVAKDLLWYVAKTRRGSHAAVMLVGDFERWARERGAKHFILGQSTGVHMETTTALYKHLGYHVVGMNTVKST